MRKTLYRLWVLTNVVALLAGAGVVGGPAAAQGDYEPVFELGPCATEDLALLQLQSMHPVECGDLVVPADRSQPDGPTVRLPVVIARTTNPHPAPDPLIYLAGGGGADHLSDAGFYLERIGAAVLETRDFIQYNQRGAPHTEPSLACPGHSALWWELAAQGASYADRAAAERDFLLACQAELAAQGIDFTDYNSAVNAADARDLRIALGYEAANYYGTSYGTRLALTLMRDHPDGVRSVILDSVYPPQAEYYTEYAPDTARAYQLLFDTCAADATCNSRYPDLAATFTALIDELNAAPVTLTVETGAGDQRDIMVTGALMVEVIDLLFYSAGALPHLPGIIYTLASGNLAPIADLSALIMSDIPVSINWAMFYAMQCQEEVPFESAETAAELAAAQPAQWVEPFYQKFTAFAFDLCAAWGLPPADPVEALPVESDIPTLIFAGAHDPITPPAWGRATAAHLPNSFFYEFAGMAHGVMRDNSCALAMGLDFLADPGHAPDDACVAAQSLPRFQ